MDENDALLCFQAERPYISDHYTIRKCTIKKSMTYKGAKVHPHAGKLKPVREAAGCQDAGHG